MELNQILQLIIFTMVIGVFWQIKQTKKLIDKIIDLNIEECKTKIRMCEEMEKINARIIVLESK